MSLGKILMGLKEMVGNTVPQGVNAKCISLMLSLAIMVSHQILSMGYVPYPHVNRILEKEQK